MNSKHKEYRTVRIFGLEKNIFFIGMTSFLTDVSSKMVYSVMPLFLMSIGASKTTISLIEGIAESTASLLKAVSGFWSDKIGRNKPFMIFGYGVTALITPLYAIVRFPVQVLYFRFVERVGKGVRTAPRDSLISSSVENKEAGKSFGFHKAMDNSGAIIGPLIAFVLLYFFPLNYQNIFLIATIPAVLGVISIIFFVKDINLKNKSEKSKISLKMLPRKFYFFLLIIFVFALGNSTDALLLVKTSETGLNISYIPFIYMIFNVVSVIFAIPVGKMSDKRGRERFIIAGFLIYSIVYFGFGLFDDIRIYLMLFVLYGLYSTLTDGSQKAMISDITGKELKGTAFGIYHAVIGIALLPASLIAGLLYDKVDSGAPFYFGSLMSLVACVMMLVFWLYYRKRKHVEA
jgi:MFS family permease